MTSAANRRLLQDNQIVGRGLVAPLGRTDRHHDHAWIESSGHHLLHVRIGQDCFTGMCRQAEQYERHDHATETKDQTCLAEHHDILV